MSARDDRKRLRIGFLFHLLHGVIGRQAYFSCKTSGLKSQKLKSSCVELNCAFSAWFPLRPRLLGHRPRLAAANPFRGGLGWNGAFALSGIL